MVSKVALLASTVAVARGTEPGLFARYVAWSAIAMVAAGVWDFGSSTLASRATAGGGEHTVGRVLADVAGIRLRLAPLWLAIIVAGAVALRGSQLSGVALFAAVSLVFACHAPLLACLRGCMRFRQAAIAWAAGRWFATAATISIILLGHRSLAAIGAAALLGESATFLAAAIFLRTRPSRRAAPQVTLRQSAPLAANGLLSLAYNRLDVLLVTALAGTGQLDRYAPATRFQDALYFAPVALATVGLPVLALVFRKTRDVREVGRFATKLAVAAFLAGVPASTALCVFAPRIMKLALGNGYAGAATSVSIVVWFLPFSAVINVMTGALIAVGRSSDTTRIFVCSFAVSLVLHLSLDRSFGAVGGAIATVGRDFVGMPLAIALAARGGLISWPFRVGRRRLVDEVV